MRQVLLISVLSTAACAPLVSNRDWQNQPGQRLAWEAEGSTTEVAAAEAPAPAVVARAEPAPAPAPEPEPVVAPEPAPAPAPAPEPVLVARAEPAPAPAPEAEEAIPVFDPDLEPEAEPEPEVKTLYSYSDQQIRKLRRRNRKFNRVFKKHKRCQKKTERLLKKRADIRDRIIYLQNLDYPTPRQQKKLRDLRDKEHQMKRDRSALAACIPLEEQLTDMLRETYDATASAY